MEILIIIFLIIIGILFYQDHPMFANVFILLAGLFSFTGITTNQITAITGTTITYGTIDPLISYAISFIFIAMALINYLDLIDTTRSENNERRKNNYEVN